MVDLLFQVKNDDFGEEITSKPYSKYIYQSNLEGRKPAEKETFLRSINGGNSDHLYDQNPLINKDWCFFCPKKASKAPLKEQETSILSNRKKFQLNQEDLIEIEKKERSKKVRIREKQTKEWCQECKKFICNDCWSLYY